MSYKDVILGGKRDLGQIKLHDSYLAPRPSQVGAIRALAGRVLPFERHQSGTWLSILAFFLAVGIIGIAFLINLFIERRVRARELRARELRARELEQEARQLEMTPLLRARQEHIESFPTVYLDIESVHEVACPVCLVDYTDGDHAMFLPTCNHLFCVRCIHTSWSTSTLLRCPLCRMDYTSWRPERALFELV